MRYEKNPKHTFIPKNMNFIITVIITFGGIEKIKTEIMATK